MVSVNKSQDLQSELEVILSKVAESEKLKNCNVALNLNVNIGDGFMGRIYTAEITDKNEQKKVKVVIKLAPIGDFDFATLYKNEVTFYTLIYPALMNLDTANNQLFNNVPKLYAWSIQDNNSYLVMENLTTLGYTLHAKEEPFDERHLNLVFKTFGKFHALSFVWRSRDPTTFNRIHQEEYRDLTDLKMNGSKNIFQNCLQAAISYLDPNSPVYLELETLPKKFFPTLVKTSHYTGQYSCSVHGDCWSNNLMFQYEKSGELQDLKIIDFQLGRQSTPVHDLSYFFYSSAAKADLDKLDHYLKVYYATFSETLKKCSASPDEIFPYKVLIEEWKKYALFGLIQGIHLWEIKLTPKSAFAEDLKSATGGENSGQTDHEKILEVFEKFRKLVPPEKFKERAVPLLIHGYEFGFLKKDKFVEDISETSILVG